MNDFFFPERLSRRGLILKRKVQGMVRNPCRSYEDVGLFDISDLANRVTVPDAENTVAAQLGDGKETDGTTNRPDCQTNPALFAAPHSPGRLSEVPHNRFGPR